MEGYECDLEHPEDFASRSHFNLATNSKDVPIMIGIHALRTGQFMKDSCLPYILILGGTDMNVFCDDPSSMDIMTEAVYGAKFVVCFSLANQMRALSLWPAISPGRLQVISQAVQTCQSSFNLQTYLASGYPSLSSRYPHRHKPIVFAFVGGIRPVKNPVYLVSTFQDWHARDSRVIYLMVGPKLDEDYTAAVYEPAITRRPGIVYIPGLQSDDTHAVIRQSFALVNTSDSEGMCLAMLEAMHLGVPVLARDCPGNRAIVTDGRTGHLFHSPETFLEKAEQLVENSQARSDLTRHALQYVHRHHNLQQERLAYTALLKLCVKDIEADL